MILINNIQPYHFENTRASSQPEIRKCQPTHAGGGSWKFDSCSTNCHHNEYHQLLIKRKSKQPDDEFDDKLLSRRNITISSVISYIDICQLVTPCSLDYIDLWFNRILHAQAAGIQKQCDAYIYIYIVDRASHQQRPSATAFSSQQRPSWLSWQSVALDSRGREFDSHRRPWSCIFRKWSRLSLRKFTHSQKYPYRLPLVVIECKMPIVFLIYPYNVYIQAV